MIRSNDLKPIGMTPPLDVEVGVINVNSTVKCAANLLGQWIVRPSPVILGVVQLVAPVVIGARIAEGGPALGRRDRVTLGLHDRTNLGANDVGHAPPGREPWRNREQLLLELVDQRPQLAHRASVARRRQDIASFARLTKQPLLLGPFLGPNLVPPAEIPKRQLGHPIKTNEQNYNEDQDDEGSLETH